MEQITNFFLNTPSYILIAIGLVLIIILVKKTKKLIRKISGLAFTILTILKLVHVLGLMDFVK